MNLLRTVIFALTLVVVFSMKAAGSPIIFTDSSSKVVIGKQVELLIETGKTFDEQTIASATGFFYSNQESLVLLLKDKQLWGRFTVQNKSAEQSIFLSVQYPNISELTLYKVGLGQRLQAIYTGGIRKKFSERLDEDENYTINLQLPPGTTADYYLKIKSQHPLDLKLMLLKSADIDNTSTVRRIIMATYLAVTISFLLYNLFLFFATRDKSYFFYVIYLATLAIAQFTMAGLAFKYFWPNLPVLNNYSIIWTSALAGIAAVYFSISFLHTSTYLPLVHKSLIAIIVVYVGALAVSFFPANYLSYIILNFNGMIAGLLLIYTSYSIYKRGYRPALYYLLAWSAFLLGMIIFVLRNLRILPSNNFTNYVLYAGSAIEVVLLAIALAEKINILRKEKESSQQEALQISLENEKLVKEQNYLLEQKVAERTEELQLAHGKVSSAFKNLKDAQIQLVEAEKMASLGQLTAGIAHEINNPINFVKSNIKPLQLDLKDVLLVIDEYEKLHQAEIDVIPEQLQKIAALKKKIDLDFVRNEMSDLMKGIENGAERTAEIVRGLRTFSRLDESVIKTVNIHEGVDTTLLLLRSSISENVKIEKHYAAEGSIECFPGKLNQVFMNLLSNAIHAIKTKETLVGNETITISTRDIEDNKIQISIKDSGKGMSKEVLQKIFEPFFTTKDVGEGTGLGLAIVFKIIQEHAGKIDVLSEEGNGTEFTITLNHSIPVKAGKSN